MKNIFSGYYRPNESEFRELWEKCLFVLDANVLLNLYRYSAETRSNLLKILSRIQSRLWVPHQAALEYQRNRLVVISSQREAYEKIQTLLRDAYHQIEAGISAYRRHPLIDPMQVLAPIDSVLEDRIMHLKTMQEKHPDFTEADEVRDALTALLEEHVGGPYSEEKLAEIQRQGEQRYAKAIPPGYKDVKSKSGGKEYGDLVLWFQVLDKAVKQKSPIIIITDDAKEDWWWRHEGKIVGPKPELIEEMRMKAGVEFYMYRSDQFMEQARHFLEQKVDQGAIDEVREITKRDEQLRVEIEQFSSIQRDTDRKLLGEYQWLEERNADVLSEIEALELELQQLSAEQESTSDSEIRKQKCDSLMRRLADLRDSANVLGQRRYELERLLSVEKAPFERKLSPREKGIAKLVAEGLSNRQIARQLGISEHTLRNYLFRIFDKLGVSDRIELAIFHGKNL
jgi:DNA-binding CsgD family transcriptional regulator